jgi:hypothetical protein
MRPGVTQQAVRHMIRPCQHEAYGAVVLCRVVEEGAGGWQGGCDIH